MKSLKRLTGKSRRSDRTGKLTSATAPAFEILEGRQLMSATTISEVSWYSPSGPQTVTYEINANGQVLEDTGDGHLNLLGGKVSQISAGLDANGNPEVYAIGTVAGKSASEVLVNAGSGWTDMNATAKQISASVHGTLYTLNADNSVSEHSGAGFNAWQNLGEQATQISAGVDAAGNPEVYAIGIAPAATAKATLAIVSPILKPIAVPILKPIVLPIRPIAPGVLVDDGKGWLGLGGTAKQISAGIDGTVYEIGSDNAVYGDTDTGAGGWKSLGGQATQISAGVDAAGNPEVYATGNPSPAVFVNDGQGWVPLSGAGIQLATAAFGAPTSGNTYATTGLNGQAYLTNAAGTHAMPQSEPTAKFGGTSYTDVSKNPLFAPGGPTANDVNQRGIGDCYFMAALAEVALRDPSLIRSDIIQRTDGTYDVYFHSGTTIVDEHVDGYLPSDGETSTLGVANCTWAVIMEKAFTYFRNPNIAPAYTTIEGGSGYEALSDIGGTNVTEQSFSSGGIQMFNTIAIDLARNQAVLVATNGTAGPLYNDHEYSVIAERYTVAGGDQYLVRNPWGLNYAAAPNYADGFVPNANGYDATNDGYRWVSCASILPQIDELVTATV